MGSNANVPWGSVDIRVDSGPSIEIDGGEEATEMASHIRSDGLAEDGDEGHGDDDDDDEGLPVEGSGRASISIAAQSDGSLFCRYASVERPVCMW